MKKIIETVLPLREINASAIVDRAKKGHPGNMHLWWNRSPIDSSAALLKAAIENYPKGDDSSSQDVLLRKLIQIAEGDTINPCLSGAAYPTVCDPFSGYGGLTIAAQTLGLKVEAGDLNSVATLLTKAAAEIPARFSDGKAVNPDAENKMYFGSEGLAADIAYYGEQIKQKARQTLSACYPEVKTIDSESAPVYSWIWVRTMRCPNPACGCEMPLASSYVLSRNKGHEYWAEPEVVGKKIHFSVHQGICPDDRESNKHGSRGAEFICPACGQITKDEDVKKAGIAHQLHIQLMAVCIQDQKEKSFREADEDQISAASVEMPDDIPSGMIPDNTRWFSTPAFGLTKYADLYTSRQLQLMTTLCNLVSEEILQITRDAVIAGMSQGALPLEEGGSGALAYGQAVGVYLALVIGKLANYQSTICTWDNRNGNVRAAFTRQAIPMTWVFAEGNPFSKPTGNYETLLKNVVDSVSCLHARTEVVVKQKNAVTMQFPDHSIMFTELPYYENVGYADLSDYFYIWLRKCLKDVYLKLFEKIVTSKEELSSIPEHYNGDTKRAIASYQYGIQQMLDNFHEKASDEYPSVLFFEYGKRDESAISQSVETELSPFENLVNSIFHSGFGVTGIWPVRTEKPNQRFESFRVAVVFRKIDASLPGTTRRGFINVLKRELPTLLDTAYGASIEETDKPVAGLGMGMQVFSKFHQVMNADGSKMGIHDVLNIIYQEVSEYLSVHAVAADTEEA